MDYMILIEYEKGRFVVRDRSSIDLLRKGHLGEYKKSHVTLTPEEALYLIDMRNAECTRKGKKVTFNELASKYQSVPKFTARYLTYKDWRDRGLIIRAGSEKITGAGKTSTKEYPRSELKLPKYNLKGIFFKSDLITTLDQDEGAKELYDNYWIGQYGSYKAADRGKLNKLDIYETMLLMSKNMLSLEGMTRSSVIKLASARRKDFPQLYGVYSDWREKGYIIKTGFKFGTHFRVYFPGAKPTKQEDTSRVHSKHVIHVFPKESRLLISEWARVIRVAHSVRKTFILAVPGTKKSSNVKIDYILYHRKGGLTEMPDVDNPRYGMLSLSEEEFIGGNEFASAIKVAKDRKLELILAIVDRETAVTYYKARQITLKGSKNEYYEIEWIQP